MILDDENFRIILDMTTVVWLLGWAIGGLRNIVSHNRHPVSFLLLAHFVFCGVPLFLDHTIGAPNYLPWPGFDIAAADGLTALVYCLYASVCPLIWWYCGRWRGRRRRDLQPSRTAASLSRLSWQGKTALHLGLVSPIAALSMAPNPMAYSQYAAVVRGTFSAEELAYHAVLTTFTLVSAISGAALLFCQRRMKLTCWYVLVFAVLVAWLDGKRAVVLIMGVMYGIALWSRGVLKRQMLILAGALFLAAFFFFSFSYQREIRDYGGADPAKQYDNIRLDYGRDHVIRSTLFAELHAEAPAILEYRLQSLEFDVTMLVPRRWWPDKPWPYAVYATAAAFRLPVRSLGWGVTTSWLEEAIANLGWTGLIAGPLLLAWICRAGESSQDTIVRLLTILVSSMLLAVQAVAFAPLIAIWGAALLHARRSRKPVRRECGNFGPAQFPNQPVRRPALSL